ncbi:TonB-dependent receptor [Sphingomonas gei]|nr:TonB-dependent receptor [Sphingomonas gei]
MAATLAQAPAVLAQTRAAPVVYDIPAQPLGEALMRLAKQSGRDILFDAGAMRSRVSRPVRGVRDFESALRTLLADTAIGYDLRADGAVVIRPAKSPARRRVAASSRRAPEARSSEAVEGTDLILVEGRRQETPQAREMASNTTVNMLSAEEIARRPDRNVTETLARLPGVNVMFSTVSQAGSQGNGSNYGGLDTAARGEGQFVSIRGLSGEYNVNLINGIDAAQGMPYSREVQLSLLPPIGIDNIVISKTSTADMQGDAIGGTIDFRMPTAFQSPGGHVSLYSDVRYEQRAADYGLKPWGYQGQLAISKTFGADDRFGVYLSGYYSLRHFANSQQTNGQFEYKIVDANKAVPAGVDPADNLQLLGFGMQMTRGETKRYGGVGSIDWNVSDAIHAFARATFARADTEQTIYQIGIQGGRSGFATAVPLGGTSGLARVVSNQQELHYWSQSNPSRDTLGTALLGFDAKIGRLTATPQAYYSWGANDFPNHFEVTFYNRGISPTGDDTDTNYQVFKTGVGIGYRDGYPMPIFTPGILTNVRNIANWRARNRGEVTDGKSNQHKHGFKLDLRYDAGTDWLEAIRFGAKYSDAQRFTSFRDIQTDAAVAAGATLGNSGLVDTTLSSVIPGVYNYALPLISPDRFWAAYSANGGFNVNWSPDDYNGNTVTGREQVASSYMAADLRLGSVEVTAGIRYEHVDVHNRFWISGNQGVDKTVKLSDGTTQSEHYGWSASDSSFDEVLPSLTAAWRPNGRSAYRAAIWTSYTRPPFIQLAGNTSTSVDADGNVSISRGNPNLKPIEALNFDASGNWTTPFGSSLSVAGYYKHLRNFIYNAGAGFSRYDDATGGRVTISQPQNGGSGHVVGMELNLRQNFAMLPGAFGGLALAANATFQHSRVDLKVAALDRDEHMQNAPRQLYNASLIYDKYGFIADLSYHYSSDYIAAYGLWGTSSFGSPMNSSALDQWVHARGQFDLSLAYSVTPQVQLRLAAQNLTNTRVYYDTIGRYSTVVPQNIDAGRSFLLSARLGF